MAPCERLIRGLYALAVEEDWARFRELALEKVCGEFGLAAGVWLTQAMDQAYPGEFTAWPPTAVTANTAQLQALPLRDGTDIDVDLPASAALRQGVALRQAHQDSRLTSRLVFWPAPGARPLDKAELRHVIEHMVEAGQLALQHFILSDERLSRWGRSNRGSAAMVDAHGTLYAASKRFRELLGEEFGDPNLVKLPFKLPEEGSEERGSFGHGTLRFRLVPTDSHRFQLYARKVQALDGLSPREQEIARALAAGKTLKSVARQCGIATSTVANHASRIYRKLGIYRREELFELIRSTGGTRGKAGSGEA